MLVSLEKVLYRYIPDEFYRATAAVRLVWRECDGLRLQSGSSRRGSIAKTLCAHIYALALFGCRKREVIGTRGQIFTIPEKEK